MRIYHLKVGATERFKNCKERFESMHEIPRRSHSIQFYYKPAEPVSLDSIVGKTEGNDFRNWLANNDLDIMQSEWGDEKTPGTVKFVNPNAKSDERGLLCLYDTSQVSQGHVSFIFTDFATYVAASRTSEKGMAMSHLVYNAMRVGSVGGAIYSLEGDVFVHKRPTNATHVADKRDASTAGLIFSRHVESGEIKLILPFQEKLKREWNLTEEELEKLANNANGYSIKLTSIHSSAAPDLSGMVDAVIHLPFETEDLKKKASPVYLHDINIVTQRALPEYLVEHFLTPSNPSEGLIPDGLAVLSSSLPYQQFKEVVDHINFVRSQHSDSPQTAIRFGELQMSSFVEKGKF